MTYKLDYGKGKIVEMEREELEEKYYVPKSWKFSMIEDYMSKFQKIKITEGDSREQRIYKRLCGIKRPKVGFKIGDTIKLKDYSEYEYPHYKNQVAKITDKMSSSFDWQIKWKDGSTSCIKEDNMTRVDSNGA